ncbi:homoserine kinase [Desulfonatronum sp. SC1]|uniref:homoserine kinase n=1 Tax=Desulfonatronum sp. SC1 TaxID=2109626 RepID=UPI000D305A68|nr:homoserine kinase [Desulfonatronum sp. SC1]PTN38525.1 shikimate kinase [Desulfonatronum sp. SC1]
MPTPYPDLRQTSPDLAPRTVPCLSLIGMAGAGKSTLGRALAEDMGWALVDTDRLMEAHWGAPLQALLDRFGLEGFLRAEEDVVAKLWLWRTVVATGGSVVYGPRAVRRLRELGPVVYLRVGVDTIRDRVRDARGRGLARKPDQTLEQLYDEREPLYRAAADLTLDMDDCSIHNALERLRPWLADQLNNLQRRT